MVCRLAERRSNEMGDYLVIDWCWVHDLTANGHVLESRCEVSKMKLVPPNALVVERDKDGEWAIDYAAVRLLLPAKTVMDALAVAVWEGHKP